MGEVLKDTGLLVVASLLACQVGALWMWRAGAGPGPASKAAFVLAPLPVVAAGAYVLWGSAWIFPTGLAELIVLGAMVRLRPPSWVRVFGFLVVAWVYAAALIAVAVWFGARHHDWGIARKGAMTIAEVAGVCVAAPMFRRLARRCLAESDSDGG